MTPRFYLPQTLTPDTDIALPQRLVTHMQVLRLKMGDDITLFDGQGSDISARIIEMGKKNICARLDSNLQQQSPPSLKLHLGQALCRFDRMDLILQKAIELNVTDITPLYAARSQGRLKGESLERKMLHWQEVIISASEQCHQNYLPTLHTPIALEDWLAQVQADLKLQFTLEAGASLKTIQAKPTSIALLIGPEGGLSDTETQLADQQAFVRITLGERVLRVETAAILALGLASYQFS